MEEKNNDIDWDILKKPLIFFSICLVIASMLIGGSYYFNSELNAEYKSNRSIFQSISRRYLDVDQEEKLLRDYYPQFIELYDKGIIGREKRLNWLEALRQAGGKNKLPLLNYSISSQEEHVPEYNVNYSGYTLYRSSMELNLGLLHEGDLFKLLNHIDQYADGVYTISECSFRMNGNEIKFEKNTDNISVQCLLNWLTIDLANGEGIKIG